MYLCFMYSRRLYAKIVGGAVLIVLLSLIGSWLLITRLSFFLSFVCLLFILLINSVYNPVSGQKPCLS